MTQQNDIQVTLTVQDIKSKNVLPHQNDYAFVENGQQVGIKSKNRYGQTLVGIPRKNGALMANGSSAILFPASKVTMVTSLPSSSGKMESIVPFAKNGKATQQSETVQFTFDLYEVDKNSKQSKRASLFDEEGNLIATSDYPIAPKTCGQATIQLVNESAWHQMKASKPLAAASSR